MNEENPRGPVPSPRKLGSSSRVRTGGGEGGGGGVGRSEKNFQYHQRIAWIECKDVDVVHTDALYIEVAFARSRVMVLRASRVI